MIKIISKISFVIFLALILSTAVDYIFRKTYNLSYQPPKNILPHSAITDKYKLVRLGNSHSVDGYNFDNFKVKSLNLSSVAQTFEYDLAMLKMHSNEIDKNAIIVINISPISFSQIKPDRKANVNTQYYDGRLSPFLIPHIKIAEYLQVQIFPFTRAGYIWRSNHSKGEQANAMDAFAENWGPPEKNINPVENTINPEATSTASLMKNASQFNVPVIIETLNSPANPSNKRLIDSMNFIYNKWYNSGGFDEASFETNRKDLQKIIDYSIEKGWRPVLTTLPISQVLIDGLKPDYMKRYLYDNLEKIDKKSAKYFEFASDSRLTNNQYLFSNADHLNARGSIITSYILLQKLIGIGYLPKTADGYDYSTK